MKKVLAVSGGVDSMVMLELALRKFSPEDIVIATFDHRTRESSAKDAEFVSRIATALRLKLYRDDAKSNGKISEEKAREMRYDFLRKVAFRERGEILTAHHLDDLVESVAINVLRGTGVRGLTVLNASGVRRPFLDGTFEKVYDKRDVLEFAAQEKIIFRQDPTNTSDEYLRNRVRPRVLEMSRETKERIFELWQKQKEIINEVEKIDEAIIPEDLKFKREWFDDLDEKVAMEILRAGLSRAGISATRPQANYFLKAILEYKAGRKFNLPGDRLVKIGTRDFQLKV